MITAYCIIVTFVIFIVVLTATGLTHADEDVRYITKMVWIVTLATVLFIATMISIIYLCDQPSHPQQAEQQ